MWITTHTFIDYIKTKLYDIILNSEIVDKFISTEIPNPNKNENLHNIVMKPMIYGPCGNWCLINDKCLKHFPKSFQFETIMDKDGY